MASRPETRIPAPALEQQRRAEIISSLNRGLAHMIDLAVSAKQAHWNVQGPNFQGLHELFDTIAAEAREYADELAERCMALGGTAHGTLEDAAAGTGFAPFPTDERGWEQLTRAIHERLLGSARLLREDAESMDDDLVTQDLLLGQVHGLEKRAWMTEAHLHHA
jgi:starvation-inducible DNA-binding protein